MSRGWPHHGWTIVFLALIGLDVWIDSRSKAFEIDFAVLNRSGSRVDFITTLAQCLQIQLSLLDGPLAERVALLFHHLVQFQGIAADEFHFDPVERSRLALCQILSTFGQFLCHAWWEVVV